MKNKLVFAILIVSISLVILNAGKLSFSPELYFKDVFIGQVKNGIVCIELPINDSMNTSNSTGDLYKKWEGYKTMVARDDGYLGELVPSIDQKFIQDNVPVKTSEHFFISSESGGGKGIVDKYGISYSIPGGGYYLYAIFKGKFKNLKEQDLVIAGKNLEMPKKYIQKKISSKEQESIDFYIKTALGDVTPSSNSKTFKPQYVKGCFLEKNQISYLVYYPSDSNVFAGKWKLDLLNENFKKIKTIAEDGYINLIPVRCADFNNDGLDEIIIHQVGYEGDSWGIMYRDFNDKENPLKILATSYYGA
jgi:hypothetical protein